MTGDVLGEGRATSPDSVHATGISPEDCYNEDFTKAGQDVKFNQGCLSGATVDAKYCSDSDTVAIAVSSSKIPIGKATTTLKVVPC